MTPADHDLDITELPSSQSEKENIDYEISIRKKHGIPHREQRFCSVTEHSTPNLQMGSDSAPHMSLDHSSEPSPTM